MIRHATRAPRCLVCDKPATRSVFDRADRDEKRRRIFLCSSCPDPQQIDAAAFAINQAWTDRQRLCRHFDCRIGQASRYLEYDVRDHICTLGSPDADE